MTEREMKTLAAILNRWVGERDFSRNAVIFCEIGEQMIKPGDDKVLWFNLRDTTRDNI